MNAATAIPTDQRQLWNGPAGQAWVESQDLLDRMFLPFETVLVDAIGPAAGGPVLDIGCGTGATTLAIARRLGIPVVGLDISEPMIALARERSARENLPAHFIAADGQTHEFEPARFQRIVSRFGIMFFDDPVAAFANLRRAATRDAQLHGIAWRSVADNPFMTTAERAAAPLLPALPPRVADAPGQFAFADPQRVERLLHAAGWSAISLTPLDVECSIPASDLERYAGRLGPVGIALQAVDEQTRRQVSDTLRAAFEPFVHGDTVRFVAACWMITARNA
ncbi:class I SAM-dependent methyltransferase [Tahibacter amnicola]|uniref:Class I SAM-dependent methyltransferase n=1 Tax=Tahibacter amnicola TaxID=2976241 RepID=A0ABY6BLD7_9GAMM|nr:class I SAM-dependent methyltransferase [Tahibacter amnicola]UXI70584.1 class I SAM-dependent methyltransferase [Tahibacter amnicola]